MNISEIKNDWERYRAYEKYGYTKEAFKDKYCIIRFNAYENLGYTKEAMKDENPEIRYRAERYFKNKGE